MSVENSGALSTGNGPLLFRNSNVLRIWLGQALSQSGIRMAQIAWTWWLVSTRPNAGVAASLLLAMGALPSLLLVKQIGKTVESASPSRLLPRCDFLAASTLACAAALTLAGTLNLPLLCLISLILATVQAHFDPGLQKSISSVADKSDLESAVSIFASTQTLANFGGAVFGAVLVGQLGLLGVTLLACAGYLASGLLIRTVKFQATEPSPSTHAAPSQETDEPADETSAWRLLGRFPVIRKVLVAFGVTNFFGPAVLVIMPIYVRTVLGGTAAQLGLLEAAVWLGLLSGILFSGRLKFPFGAIRTGAVCLAVYGLCLLVPGMGGGFIQFAAALVVAGFALGTNNVKFMTLFQEAVPAEIKGRFFAALQAALGFAMPAGYFAFGVACDHLGARGASLIQGAGVLAIAAYFGILSTRSEATKLQASAPAALEGVS